MPLCCHTIGVWSYAQTLATALTLWMAALDPLPRKEIAVKNPVEIRDFGWWAVPYSWVGWLLTWRASDRKLRLVESGLSGRIINLGQYDLADVETRLAGWSAQPHCRGWLDASWLATKFPALFKWIELARAAAAQPYDQDNDLLWLRQNDDGGFSIAKVDAAEAWMPPCTADSRRLVAVGAAAEGHGSVAVSDAAPSGQEIVAPQGGSDVAADPPVADSNPPDCDHGHVEANQYHTTNCDAPHSDDPPFSTLSLIEAAHVMVEPTTTEEALDLLRACRFAKDRIAILEREAVNFLADVLPHGTHDVDGYGPITHRRSVSYTAWQHDDLRSKLVRQIAQDFDGDVSLVGEVIERWQRFAGKPSRYSQPALEAIGLKADEYASAQWKSDVRVEKDRG